MYQSTQVICLSTELLTEDTCCELEGARSIRGTGLGESSSNIVNSAAHCLLWEKALQVESAFRIEFVFIVPVWSCTYVG